MSKQHKLHYLVIGRRRRYSSMRVGRLWRAGILHEL